MNKRSSQSPIAWVFYLLIAKLVFDFTQTPEEQTVTVASQHISSDGK